MANERERILQMLEEGKITSVEANQLLEALEPKAHQNHAQYTQSAANPEQNRADISSRSGKKLRVEVNGKDDGKKINVSVPLTLAKLAGNIIDKCVPQDTLDSLKEDGIDLRGLDIAGMVDELERFDEDLVHVDIDGEDDEKMKVRIYVQ